MDRRSNRFQAGLLAAVLAATLQFVLWAGVLSGAVGHPAPGGTAAVAHCTMDGPSGQPHAPEPSCLLCPVCLALSLPGTLPGPPPAPTPPVPTGRAAASVSVAASPPPALALAAAYPRGPPHA